MEQKSNDNLDKVINMLLRLGQGDFDARTELSDEDDMVVAILSGLNMLAEELSYFKIELDNKNRLIQDTFHNISEIVYAIHVNGNNLEAISFDFISPRVKTLLGYTEEEIYNQSGNWFSAIHVRDVAVIKNALQRLLSGKEAVCEYRVKHKKTRSYIWLEDHMVPQKQGDTVTRIFCSARDVTARKASVEERELLIKELNNKYNELMQFNYIVSHNLRAPVTSILGGMELLQTAMSEEENKHVQELIVQSAQMLDALLKDLNIILSTKSKLNEKIERISLVQVINDIKRLLKDQIMEAGAKFTVSTDIEADEIRSIKSYLQSAIFNLVSNAIKYRKPDVKPEITILTWKKHDFIYIQVSDNGIGIDIAKHNEDLFGLYKRFNMQYEGKGLGLHMTKVQIEAIGGNIRVKSEPGEGSTFTIQIPVE